MKTFVTNTFGIDDVLELLNRRSELILRAARCAWLENKQTLKLQIGQSHRLSPSSWIVQFIASDTNSFDEIVPCFVTAVVNSGDRHLSFHFGALDIVCPCLAGMYETRILDDYPKIGFWVDWAQPSFDCRFTDEAKTEMEIETNLFLMPKPGRQNSPVKKPLKKFRIAKVGGKVPCWLP